MRLWSSAAPILLSLASPWLAGSALAADDEPQAFASCIAGLSDRARNEGISERTLAATLATAQYRQRIIDADRRQPEFTDSFARYLGLRITDTQVERGRALAETHGPLLARVSREHGVPAEILLALWAVETSFGRFFGDIPTFDALATLACDRRRSTFFAGELMAALQLVERGHVAPEDMLGSWAGAMGHVQFMPSVYLRHAVDGDGDGRADLWNSVPDALTSAANFLAALGWRPGWRWGREVRLPADFDYTLAGRGQRRPLAEWQRFGIRNAAGGPLPVADTTASLLVPSGHQGPAFLVYDNFHVLMRWNRSEFFALTVGILADRIAGAPPLVTAPPADALRLSRVQVTAMQQALNDAGFDAGSPDGIMGPATRGAIREFQHARGQIADGFPDAAVLEALGVEASP
ncbi:MAG: lytic murein transglycosylase [Gammaproteobacteria bacterium]|nr:MAG: lytic murein transglycosylase [Gammaproteobacteria bacterium]